MFKKLLVVSVLATLGAFSTSAFANSNNCTALVNGKSVNSADFDLNENGAPYSFKVNNSVTVEASLIETCVSKYDCSNTLAAKTIVNGTSVKTTKRLNYKEVENSTKSYYPDLEIESEGNVIKVVCFQMNEGY